jgi:hypothetical protein
MSIIYVTKRFGITVFECSLYVLEKPQRYMYKENMTNATVRPDVNKFDCSRTSAKEADKCPFCLFQEQK